MVRTGPTIVDQSSPASFLDWLSPVLPSQGLGKIADLEAQVTSLPLPRLHLLPTFATPSTHHPRPTSHSIPRLQHIQPMVSSITDGRTRREISSLPSSPPPSSTGVTDRHGDAGSTARESPQIASIFLEKKKNRSSHVWIPANGQEVVVDGKFRWRCNRCTVLISDSPYKYGSSWF